ncbi:uncharacterized protein METZ01_LOCUS77099 [marine metagenome]|uniref:Uncharacterized protein n=1 Tax=marine metagenome TaxID=408172 RepID=A0A381U7M1_9ZZZZ
MTKTDYFKTKYEILIQLNYRLNAVVSCNHSLD